MKKLFLFIIVVNLYCLQSINIFAINGFQPTGIKMCESNKVSLGHSSIKFALSSSHKNNILKYASHLCLDKSNIDFDISYLKEVTIGSQKTMSIFFCDHGLINYSTPLKKDGSYINEGLFGYPSCCPESHPYEPGIGGLCCSEPTSWGICNGTTVDDTEAIPVDIVISGTQSWEIPLFEVLSQNKYLSNPTEDGYICKEGCVITSNKMINSQLYNVPVTEAQIGSNRCITNFVVGGGSSSNEYLNPSSCGKIGDSDSCVCYDGASVSFNILKNTGPVGIAFLSQCAGLPDSQSQQCMDCLMKNYEKDSSTGEITNVTYYTFSSALGCVDTRTGGIVNRLIQIGLGIGSGIAILRIIQAAYLRQTNDPGKIQEGNEIMVATFLAIAVLVGAVVMLEIIGVSVLRIFTPAEFASLLGQ